MGPLIQSSRPSSVAPVDADGWLVEAIDESLQRHHVDQAQVRACLLFGSRARGDAGPDSDIDLVHLLHERDRRAAPLDYQRFLFGTTKVDTNAIPFADLNHYCSDPHWAYRLCTARPVPVRSTDPMSDVLTWIKGVHELIASGTACLHRGAVHLENLGRLLAAIDPVRNRVPHVTFYLMTEIADLGPILFLELCGKAPFQTGRPAEQINRIRSTAPARLAGVYDALTQSIESGAVGLTASATNFDEAIVALRRRGRRVMEAAWPESFGKGYAFLSEGPPDRIFDLELRLGSAELPALTSSEVFLRAVSAFVQVGRQHTDTAPKSHGIRRSSRSVSLAIDGPRIVDYDAERRRAKLILGTGGCRVPGCTFCMLPSLAHRKSSVSRALQHLRTAIHGALQHAAVYTDGSFFDDRELSDDERREVFETISGWGASEILVESLPRFVTEPAIVRALSSLAAGCSLRVGIGLQSIDSDVRTYVTGTPISDGEFEALLALRRTRDFRLRVYLLAGKPLMAPHEDLCDVERSIDRLNDQLTERDVVTVNPLLPTQGTLISALERLGYFERLSPCLAANMARRLRSKSLRFRLEFGPLTASTCTSIRFEGDVGEDWMSGACGHSACADSHRLPFGPSTLPWALLGNFALRAEWAAALPHVGPNFA